MNFTKERREYHLSQVRRLVTRDPDITNLQIVEALKKNNLTLNHNYIGKLRRKIEGAKAKRTNRYLMTQVLDEFRGRLKEADRYLWSILTNATNPAIARVAAARELREAYGDFFERLQSSGILEKHLGTLGIDAKVTNIGELLKIIDQVEKEKNAGKDNTREVSDAPDTGAIALPDPNSK